MKISKIEIQETLSRVVEIEAMSLHDAIYKVSELYKNCEIVLDYNDFVEVNFIDIESQNKTSEKNKLISDVIEYLYIDEKKNYEELDEPENHIFKKLERLKALID